MMTTALVEGLQIIGVVTIMTVVACPIFVWLLPDRSHPASPTTPA